MHPSCTGDLSQPQRGAYNDIKVLISYKSQNKTTLPHPTDSLGLLSIHCFGIRAQAEGCELNLTRGAGTEPSWKGCAKPGR